MGTAGVCGDGGTGDSGTHPPLTSCSEGMARVGVCGDARNDGWPLGGGGRVIWLTGCRLGSAWPESREGWLEMMVGSR